MSVEVLEAQEQLERARDNLRHVEEGIKKTAITSNFRFGDYEGGRGRPGRRLLGRIGGVQRFRAEDEADADEPPLKKALSSVASRLGPLNIENKPDNDNEDDMPALKSTVTLSQNQDRESASSIVNDATNLNRSKRLFGSLLMGTLRQFKQDREKTKSAESKQAEMWDKIERKEAEQVAQTAVDRKRLEAAKEEVNLEIKLLEDKMELAEMKVRAIEERDTYAQFIRTKTKPHIYYQPKEYDESAKKALKDSNYRVNKEYERRIEGYSNKISEVERKIAKSDGGVEKQLGELNTVKIEKLTRTVSNDRGDQEEKAHNPATGIKVEVQLRHGAGTGSDTEPEQRQNNANNHTPPKSAAKPKPHPRKRSRSISPAKRTSRSPAKRRSKSPGARKRESPTRPKCSPKRRASPRRARSSPRRKSRSPRRKSRSPKRKSRSPRRRQPKKSPLKANRKSRSVSPANRNVSKKEADKSKPVKSGRLPTKAGEDKDSASSKSSTKSKSKSKSRSKGGSDDGSSSSQSGKRSDSSSESE